MCDYIACVYHLALSFGSNDDDDDNPEAVQRQRRELLKRNARARNIRAAILDFTACFDVDARAIERTHPEVHLKDSWTWISMRLGDGRIQGVLWQILWGATVAARALTKINNKRRIYTRRWAYKYSIESQTTIARATLPAGIFHHHKIDDNKTGSNRRFIIKSRDDGLLRLYLYSQLLKSMQTSPKGGYDAHKQYFLAGAQHLDASCLWFTEYNSNEYNIIWIDPQIRGGTHFCWPLGAFDFCLGVLLGGSWRSRRNLWLFISRGFHGLGHCRRHFAVVFRRRTHFVCCVGGFD